MGKRQAKKGSSAWSKLITRMAISLLVYLAGVFVYALLIVNGVLSDSKEAVVLCMWLTISVACGGMFSNKANWNSPLLSYLLQGGCFCVLLLMISHIFWEGPVWSADAVTMLLCALLGSLLPLLLPGRKGKRKKNNW